MRLTYVRYLVPSRTVTLFVRKFKKKKKKKAATPWLLLENISEFRKPM